MKHAAVVVLLLLHTCFCVAVSASGRSRRQNKEPEPSPLDRYVVEATERAGPNRGATAGSLWNASSPLADLSRDLRASRVDDLVTILVSERASATSKGATNTSRKSDTKNSVAALLSPTKVAGPLSDLARVSGQTKLDGQGTTTRASELTTTVSARVAQILPNGYLVVEGVKDTLVNSERQIISVRGVVRPADLTPGNVVRSDRLAQLEVRINGKGVVGDAIRRPFILYRLLLGLLPF
jgi:flagellar L-ring protein precursor FlgH